MNLFVRATARGAVAALASATLLLGTLAEARAQAVPVTVGKAADAKWQLLRGGKPYFIQGAGGTNNLDQLKAAGGNSVRTWGAERAERDLTEAGKRGLTVTLGIWLGHPEHGFKYDDPKQVADQTASAEAMARKYKDHPALLVWGLGNEMEMSTGGKDDAVWRAVEQTARAIKRIDPSHPVMTVIAEIGEDGIKAKKVAQLCPSVDILGVNSYGGLSSLPERLKKAGWTKPYVVTEFGPNGPWEVGKTAWGAALEPNSTEKAKLYADRYAAGIAAQKGWCLGSYAFLWGDKVEGTPTWFGMFLPGTGEKLGPVDAIAAAWSGKPAANPAPRLTTFASSVSGKEVAPGSAQTVTCTAEGAPGASLTYRYEIRPDMEGPSRPEPGQVAPEALTGHVPDAPAAGESKFTAPTKPGAYRLYVYVRDGKGGAATANAPFKVTGNVAAK
jgi:hypothetical protein